MLNLVNYWSTGQRSGKGNIKAKWIEKIRLQKRLRYLMIIILLGVGLILPQPYVIADIVYVVILILIIYISSYIQTDPLWKGPEQFKNSAVQINYLDLARNPDNYISTRVYFTGKVVQTIESGNNVILRVNVTEGDYGIWQDTLLVNYSRSEGESRILENDIINLWGKVKGLKTYKALLKNQITVPEVDAKYISIEGHVN